MLELFFSLKKYIQHVANFNDATMFYNLVELTINRANQWPVSLIDSLGSITFKERPKNNAP